jgi:hypothetical protein
MVFIGIERRAELPLRRRRFFEKLWWYDQVVFKMSKAFLVFLLFYSFSEDIALCDLLTVLS